MLLVEHRDCGVGSSSLEIPYGDREMRMRQVFLIAAGLMLLNVSAGRAGAMGARPAYDHRIVESAVGYAIGTSGCVCGGGGGMAGRTVWMAAELGSVLIDRNGYQGMPAVAAPFVPVIPSGQYLWSAGGGHSPVHYRYPYYSYRSPWMHPGPAVPNVTILW